jgi:hypothetical protein
MITDLLLNNLWIVPILIALNIAIGQFTALRIKDLFRFKSIVANKDNVGSNTFKDILGLNRRNQEYIRPFNPPSAKALADNKLATKKMLAREGISAPEVYKVIKSRKQLAFLDWNLFQRVLWYNLTTVQEGMEF